MEKTINSVEQKDLFLFIKIAVGLLILSLGIAIVGVYYLNFMEKETGGTFVFFVFCVVYLSIVIAPFLPFKSIKNKSSFHKLEISSVFWMFLTVVPHITYELMWVVARPLILEGLETDTPWSFLWQVYMVGGDSKYLNGDISILLNEFACVVIGLIGVYALYKWFKDDQQTLLPLYLIMAICIADFYPTFIYFAKEILEGFPSIDMTNVFSNLVLKYFGSNIFWLICPIYTYVWCSKKITRICNYRHSNVDY